MLFLVFAISCKPDFGTRDSLVDRVEILAVRVDPPEAKPGESVTFRALVASPGGTIDPPSSWTFCDTPKLLTENGAVSPRCDSGGTPVAATATLPADGCAVFGPEISSADLRPRDPDETGGFYQPVRFTTNDATAFGFARLRCKPGNVSGATAADFAAKYVPNRNPSLVFTPPAEAARGATLTLTASWPETESYALVDLRSQAIVMRRETMRVTWYATAGTFDHDRTGRAADDLAQSSDNAWTAPSDPGSVTFWVVLRDDRGGATWSMASMTVR